MIETMQTNNLTNETPQNAKVLNVLYTVLNFFTPADTKEKINIVEQSQVRITVCCMLAVVLIKLIDAVIYFGQYGNAITITKLIMAFIVCVMLWLHKLYGKTVESAIVLWFIALASHTYIVFLMESSSAQLVWWGMYPLGIVFLFNQPKLIAVLVFITMLSLYLQMQMFPPNHVTTGEYNSMLILAMITYFLLSTVFVIIKRALIAELQTALNNVKTLEGLLPICSNCKAIRNSSGSYEQIEDYIERQMETSFTHTLCPECVRKLYPEIADSLLENLNTHCDEHSRGK